MLSSYLRSILSVFAASLLWMACSKDNNTTPVLPDPLKDQQLIASGYAIGAATKVEVWAAQLPTTGYNPLTVVLYDSVSQQKTTNAVVQLNPLMDMKMNGMTHQHAAPKEDPQIAASGLLEGAVVFTMPTSETGTWQLAIAVDNKQNQHSGTALLPVTVKQNPENNVKVITTTTDKTTLIITWIMPPKLVVGANDFICTVHRKQDGMHFPADSSYQLTITPEMPSMGHGSPNNIDPVHTGKGHYKGQVNFTMTGLWRINMSLLKEGAPVTTGLFFETTLP